MNMCKNLKVERKRMFKFLNVVPENVNTGGERRDIEKRRKGNCGWSVI